jgi:hypothetical protein
MKVWEKRKFKRVDCNFVVTLFDEGLNLFVHGVTADLSRCGAFVQIQPFDFFGLGTPLTITVFLPPKFTGQDKTVRLQGEAVILRIDEAHKGVAVTFRKPLRQFKRVGEH